MKAHTLKAKKYYNILQSNAFQKMFKKFPTNVRCNLGDRIGVVDVSYKEFISFFDESYNLICNF